MEKLRYAWIWLTSRFPHRCNHWQIYWEAEWGRVLMCGACGKMIDEEVYGE